MLCFAVPPLSFGHFPRERGKSGMSGDQLALFFGVLG